MKNYLRFSFILLITSSSFAAIRNYSTTRMLSLAGAGVGSINMVDSTSLNPAAAGFYTGSLFYAQGTKSSNFSSNQPASEPEGVMLALTDTTNLSRGAFSFQKYEEQGIKRMRFGGTMANPVGKQTSLGASYFYTIDKNDLMGRKEKYHSGNLGVSHIFNEKLTMGIVANNVNREKSLSSEATIGFQFSPIREIAFLIDGGFDYRKNFEKSMFYKLGAQLRFLKDFVFRGGIYDHRVDNLKGYSLGAGWISPRMTIELGYKKSKARDKAKEVALLSSSTAQELQEMTASLIFKIK